MDINRQGVPEALGLRRRLSRRSRLLRLVGAAASLMVVVAGIAVVQSGDNASAAICDSTVPMGAIAPAVPEWCKEPLAAGMDTHTEGGNSWFDNFDHGQTHASLSGGYVAFERQGFLTDSMHWQHNNHWMTDIQASAADFGGTVMRPDRSFRFENGKLVIEADVAAGIADYEQSGAWVELGVTTAPAPTGNTVDHLYAYGLYGGYDSFGCRLQPSRVPVCALYAPNGVRTWEMSNFQWVAPTVYGGYPSNGLENAWRVCQGTDPDLMCRDKFRLELTKTSVVLYVNGVRYFEQSGATLFPDSMVNGDVYVTFSDWVYKVGDRVVRYHWDNLGVNASAGGGGTPPPPTATTAVPTATATATPTSTPAATATPSDGLACRVAVQQYVRGKWRTIRYETMPSSYCTN